MIISRTPYRISYCGGGTDYLEYFRNHQGLVVGSTIDKYCFILAKQILHGFDYYGRIVYREIEEVQRYSDIKHPAFKAALEHLNIAERLEISHISDVPAKSGLGTSSAFMVGLVHALSKLKFESWPQPAALAQTAFAIEKHLMQENVGLQDQMFAAFGGFNVIAFKNDSIDCYDIGISENTKNALAAYTLLLSTKQERWSSEIVSSYITQLTLDKKKHNDAIFVLANKAINCIQQQDFEGLGRLIHHNWVLKRDLSSAVSNKSIDEWYEAALDNGAFGGKILGGGGGGTLMLIAPPEKHEAIVEATGLEQLHFSFTDKGSEIIHG